MRLSSRFLLNILLLLSVVFIRDIAYAEVRSLAWDYLEEKKYDEAEKSFRKLIKMRPCDTQGYLGLGKVYQEKNEHNEALKWFNKALKINPGDGAIYESIGEIYENQSSYEEAIRFYKEAIRLNPNNMNVYYKIAFTYKKQNNFDEAIRWSKEAIRVNPKSGKGYISLGLVYEDMGKFKEAIKYFKEAIKIDPNEDKSYIGIGNAYMRDNKYKDAIEWYEKVNHADGFICAHEGLGLAYRKLGNSLLAKENFLTIVRLSPYSALGYHDLADYYRHLGQLSKARDNIEKALSLAINKDDMRGILETKGLILVMQGDDISAEQIFRSLIKEYGVNCPTLSGLGYIANARKDYETAKKYFEDALKQPDIIPADTSPINDKAIILLGLAWVNANEHKYKEAISCYQKILKEEPIAVFALVGMGDAYTQLGEYAKAEVYFKRALAINSEFPVQLNREPLKEKESKI